jgi:hypothetical protein
MIKFNGKGFIRKHTWGLTESKTSGVFSYETAQKPNQHAIWF